ncbi:hypothetical protein CSOJ01_05989 [Colletotrichum sojae]|uniref:Uncharacterized protein n=1 Tax=Colletotrichum sojae TaxID=2175907 RepID=A0A8H6JEH8_9PEZI|nr:hypothetical protein CSOJ01_05989 [Colletotrichum sojae]
MWEVQDTFAPHSFLRVYSSGPIETRARHRSHRESVNHACTVYERPHTTDDEKESSTVSSLLLPVAANAHHSRLRPLAAANLAAWVPATRHFDASAATVLVLETGGHPFPPGPAQCKRGGNGDGEPPKNQTPMRDMRAASLVGDPGRLAGPMAATRGSIGASRLTGVAQGLGADVFAVILRREGQDAGGAPLFLLLSRSTFRPSLISRHVQIGPGGVGSTAGGISPVVRLLSIFLYICLSWHGETGESRASDGVVWLLQPERVAARADDVERRPAVFPYSGGVWQAAGEEGSLMSRPSHPLSTATLRGQHSDGARHARSVVRVVHKKGHQRNHELVFPSHRIPQATVDKENPSSGLPLDSTEWRLWDGQRAAEAAAQGPGGLRRPRRAGDDEDEKDAASSDTSLLRGAAGW